MINTAFFQKMNPNYSRPKIDAVGELKPKLPYVSFDIYNDISETVILSHDQIKNAEIKLLIIT
jgi:hypothetical protein